MGGAISWILEEGNCRKMVLLRRPVVKEFEKIINNPEAMIHVLNAIKEVPPGTTLRWDKLVKRVNYSDEPTEEKPDPVRVEVDEEKLKKVLLHVFEETGEIRSDGLTLMREWIPKFYDKHSLERGRRVSQRDRDTNGLTDECYAYGELDYELFATMLAKTMKAYGYHPKGIFYDLGCGVGTIVYTAAFVGSGFIKCGGIDVVASLVERGLKRGNRFDMNKDGFPKAIRNVQWVWLTNDLLEVTTWTEATFIFMHLTAMNKDQLLRLGTIASQCVEGKKRLKKTVLAFTCTHWHL